MLAWLSTLGPYKWLRSSDCIWQFNSIPIYYSCKLWHLRVHWFDLLKTLYKLSVLSNQTWHGFAAESQQKSAPISLTRFQGICGREWYDSREIFAKQTGPICRCCRNDQVDHFCVLSLFVAYQSKGGGNSERILLIGCLNFSNSYVLEKFKGWNKPSERK